MEKYIVFGPIIIFFVFFFLLVIGFIGLVGKLVLKAKSDAWIGEVIDKSHVTKDKDDSNLKEHLYSYRVRLENVKKLTSELKIPLMIGAGVSTGEDIRSAVLLGAKGVILASAFTLASDPEAKLRELAAGFIKK